MTKNASRRRDFCDNQVMTSTSTLLVTEIFLNDCRRLDTATARRVLASVSELVTAAQPAGSQTSRQLAESAADIDERPISGQTTLRYRVENGQLILVDCTHQKQNRRQQVGATRTYEMSEGQLQRLLEQEQDSRNRWELRKLLLHLTPEQEAVVALPTSGHCWIKGESGSGKTTVAVRRAIHLARQGLLYGRPRLLLILPSRPLCQSLGKAVHTIAPEVSDEIHLATFQDWAQAMAQQHLPRMQVMASESFVGLTQEAVRLARCDTQHPVLERSVHFFVREFDEVILSQNIHHLERYLRFAREGLRWRLDSGGREAVWRAFEHFHELRRAHGTWPWAQAMQQLKTELERHSVTFDHVIVDEAQRLRSVELEVCRAVASTGSLTFLTDSEHRMARPGAHWRSLDLRFAGRTHHLPRSRRSNQQIQAFGRQVLDSAPRSHSKGKAAPRTREPLLWTTPIEDQRPLPFRGIVTGASPKLLVCKNWQEELQTIRTRVAELRTNRVRLDEIVVLARHRHFLQRVAVAFHEQALDCVMPDPHELDLDSVLCSGAVKLLTIEQATGLEFPIVFLADVNDGVFPQSSTDVPDPEFEQEEARRLLYIGVTRAISELWLTASADRLSPLLPEQGLSRVAGVD